MIVMNLTRGRIIGNAVRVAERFFPRMRGLLRTDGLAEGDEVVLSDMRDHIHLEQIKID